MRTPNINSVFYAPNTPPSDPEEMRRFLLEELNRLSAAINALAAGHVDVVHAAPTKPREGDIRLADGTDWDPLGTGQKFVGYRGGAWVLLG